MIMMIPFSHRWWVVKPEIIRIDVSTSRSGYDKLGKSISSLSVIRENCWFRRLTAKSHNVKFSKCLGWLGWEKAKLRDFDFAPSPYGSKKWKTFSTIRGIPINGDRGEILKFISSVKNRTKRPFIRSKSFQAQ